MGRQKLFIYVNITVDNWGKLERIVTATLRVSLGVDGRAKEGGGMGRGEVYSSYLRPFPAPTSRLLWKSIWRLYMRADVRAPKKTPAIQAIIWDRLLDRFTSCLLAETPLPAVIDQLERHQKELHYPSHLLNVGNSLGQEALGTIPIFLSGVPWEDPYIRDTTIELGILLSFLRGRRSKAREVARKFDNAMSARPSLQTSADFWKVSKI